ncbi:NAD-dependent epimerase/dehydratase family protein [Leucobacter komagatae]|uniref:NAD-dependent epimerase/dehydratase family protein n=1 Tax=Leucobacter komagatae TaxID=55969 RepID=UPI0009FE53CE
MSVRPSAVVVGGTGFIGSQVSAAFVELGYGVRRVSRHEKAPNSVIADISKDYQILVSALRGANAVVHAASYVGTDIAKSREVNVLGTINLIRACQETGIKNLVYVGTTAVYGPGPHRYASPSTNPNPRSAASRDRWLLGRLGLFLLHTKGIPPSARTSFTSIIEVTELGRLIAGLAAQSRDSRVKTLSGMVCVRCPYPL